jgi:hypothetical protein
LARLRTTTSQAEVLAQAANFLKDLPAAWEAASSEQRNPLARLVFESIEIEDDRVTAVVPQPDFAPFFVKRAVDEGLLEANTNGAPVVTPSSEVMNGRKRRGSVPRLLSASDLSAFRSQTCASISQPLLDGHHVVMRRHALGITPEFVSSRPSRRQRFAHWPRPGACDPLLPSSASATRQSGLWCDRIARYPFEFCWMEQARSYIS